MMFPRKVPSPRLTISACAQQASAGLACTTTRSIPTGTHGREARNAVFSVVPAKLIMVGAWVTMKSRAGFWPSRLKCW